MTCSFLPDSFPIVLLVHIEVEEEDFAQDRSRLFTDLSHELSVAITLEVIVRLPCISTLEQALRMTYPSV